MHELSLTQNILDHTLKSAGSKRIVGVNLSIGQFSDEREEAIQFYWDDISKGTLAEGSRLQFQYVEAELKCLECGTIFHPKEEMSLCPHCSSPHLQLLSGDDIELESIDVE